MNIELQVVSPAPKLPGIDESIGKLVTETKTIMISFASKGGDLSSVAQFSI